jgi:hypothetical protein
VTETERIDHLGYESQLRADLLQIGGRLHLLGEFFAERTRGIRAKQVAHFAEFEQFQGV